MPADGRRRVSGAAARLDKPVDRRFERSIVEMRQIRDRRGGQIKQTGRGLDHRSHAEPLTPMTCNQMTDEV
jgi:hypothetical protein